MVPHWPGMVVVPVARRQMSQTALGVVLLSIAAAACPWSSSAHWLIARKGLASVCLLSDAAKSLYWVMGSDQSLPRRVHWSRLGRRRVTVTQSRPWTSSAVPGCWGACSCCLMAAAVVFGLAPLPVLCAGGAPMLWVGVAPVLWVGVCPWVCWAHAPVRFCLGVSPASLRMVTLRCVSLGDVCGVECQLGGGAVLCCRLLPLPLRCLASLAWADGVVVLLTKLLIRSVMLVRGVACGAPPVSKVALIVAGIGMAPSGSASCCCCCGCSRFWILRRAVTRLPYGPGGMLHQCARLWCGRAWPRWWAAGWGDEGGICRSVVCPRAWLLHPAGSEGPRPPRP